MIDTAFDEGKQEGKLEQNIAIALKLKAKGLSFDDITEITGLSESEIENL